MSLLQQSANKTKLLFPKCQHLRRLLLKSPPRNKAMARQIITPLATATHIYMDFLALAVRRLEEETTSHQSSYFSSNKEYHDHHLIAAERYLAYQKLQQLQPSAVPALDVSLAWCADVLNRTANNSNIQHTKDAFNGVEWYRHQMHRILDKGVFAQAEVKHPGKAASVAIFFGSVLAQPLMSPSYPLTWLGLVFTSAMLVGATETAKGAAITPSIAYFADNNAVITASDRTNKLKTWKQQYQETRELWQEWTQTDYDRAIPPQRLQLQPPHDSPTSWFASSVSVSLAKRNPLDPTELDRCHDIAHAISRQAPFAQNILSRTAWGARQAARNSIYVQQAVVRYSMFLHLAAAHHGRFLVPPLDVDMVWHAHQLSVLDYEEDCREICGRVLNHDFTSNYHKSLETSRCETQQLWEQTYPNMPYERRETLPSDAFASLAYVDWNELGNESRATGGGLPLEYSPSSSSSSEYNPKDAEDNNPNEPTSSDQQEDEDSFESMSNEWDQHGSIYTNEISFSGDNDFAQELSFSGDIISGDDHFSDSQVSGWDRSDGGSSGGGSSCGSGCGGD